MWFSFTLIYEKPLVERSTAFCVLDRRDSFFDLRDAPTCKARLYDMFVSDVFFKHILKEERLKRVELCLPSV